MTCRLLEWDWYMALIELRQKETPRTCAAARPICPSIIQGIGETHHGSVKLARRGEHLLELGAGPRRQDIRSG